MRFKNAGTPMGWGGLMNLVFIAVPLLDMGTLWATQRATPGVIVVFMLLFMGCLTLEFTSATYTPARRVTALLAFLAVAADLGVAAVVRYRTHPSLAHTITAYVQRPTAADTATYTPHFYPLAGDSQ